MIERELLKEFPGEHPRADFVGKVLYQELIRRRRCKSIEWRQVPVTRSNLGAREGSPGMFYSNGYVFIFGGWGFGPRRDLHAADLQRSPLEFREVAIHGTGPHPTYEAKVTVLEETWEVSSDPTCFTVMVTGGWRHGGLPNFASATFFLSCCKC